MKKRVVFTGLGILCSIAKGREDFWRGLKEGRSGLRPVTLFDTADFYVKQAGEITDFNPQEYMGTKGLRSLDRSTKLLVSAAKQAIVDSRFTITEENTCDIGVSVGTTLGSVKSIGDFHEVTLREGPRYTNPALFPNTVINSPASQVSIWHNIKGFNTTISTGFTASLDAIKYAYDFIQFGRAKLVYAGGVEELCEQTFMGFHVLQILSGSKEGDPVLNCPFDKRRNGVMLGEGACLLAMEDLEHAQSRQANILGEVIGFGVRFDPFRINRYNPRATGLIECMRLALEDAGIKADDIDYICANANATKTADKIETLAIKEVFGPRAYKIPVSAVKSMVGEGFSVSGAFEAAAALSVIKEGFIFPTINYQAPDPECDLDYVPNKVRPAAVKHSLVITASPSGNNTCMILKRYEP